MQKTGSLLFSLGSPRLNKKLNKFTRLLAEWKKEIPACLLSPRGASNSNFKVSTFHMDTDRKKTPNQLSPSIIHRSK